MNWRDDQTGHPASRAGHADTEQFFCRLRSTRNIVGRCSRHPGMGFDVNRFAPHVFNSTADGDAAVAAVRERAAEA